MRPSGNPPWANRMRITSAKLNAIEEALKAFELVDPLPAPGLPGRVVRYNGALYLDQGQSWEALVFLSQLTAHTGDTNNPHQVTAAQVGAPTQAAFDAHVADTNNPHQVTAAQLGLGEVLTHLTQILGSRIVDHNLDVADPPTGWYVRLEAGLQVCIWFGGEVTPNPPSTYQRQGMTVWSSTANRWNFAALFSTPPVCVANANISGSGRMESVIAHSITNSQASYGVEGISEFTDLLDVGMVAIGRWK